MLLSEAKDIRHSGEGWVRLLLANGDVSDAYHSLQMRQRREGNIWAKGITDAKAQDQLDKLLRSIEPGFCGDACIRIVFYNGSVRAAYREMKGK